MTSASLPTAWSEEAAGVAQGFYLREWVIGWLAVAGFGGQCVDGIDRSDGPGSCRNLGMGVRVLLKVLGIWRLAKFGCVWFSRGQLWRREEWPQPPSAAMQGLVLLLLRSVLVQGMEGLLCWGLGCGGCEQL